MHNQKNNLEHACICLGNYTLKGHVRSRLSLCMEVKMWRERAAPITLQDAKVTCSLSHCRSYW